MDCWSREAERSSDLLSRRPRGMARSAEVDECIDEGGLPRTVVLRAARPDDDAGLVGAAAMMQLDELVLYNREGDTRAIALRPAR